MGSSNWLNMCSSWSNCDDGHLKSGRHFSLQQIGFQMCLFPSCTGCRGIVSYSTTQFVVGYCQHCCVRKGTGEWGFTPCLSPINSSKVKTNCEGDMPLASLISSANSCPTLYQHSPPFYLHFGATIDLHCFTGNDKVESFYRRIKWAQFMCCVWWWMLAHYISTSIIEVSPLRPYNIKPVWFRLARKWQYQSISQLSTY